MCMGAPSVSNPPDRQPVKLPDLGAPEQGRGASLRRRAILAGLVTSPQGLGAPTVARPTLG